MIRIPSLSREALVLHLTLVVALAGAALANMACMLACFS
jgi:hypothetical protein